MVTRLLLPVLSCRKRLDEQLLRLNFVASVVEVQERVLALEQELEQVLALELEQEFEPVVAAAVVAVAAAVVAVAAAVVAVVPVQE